MPSPLKPAEFCAIVPSGTSSLCDRLLKVFLRMPTMLCDFFTYLLNEDGTLSDAFIRDVAAIPVGTVFWRASTVIPTGWLYCDGREVSRTDFPELFSVIGTKFGSGNGTTTFNLPQTKGKFLAGVDASNTNFSQIGSTGGEEEHELTAAELPVVDNSSNVQGVIDTVTNIGAAVTSGAAIQRYVASPLPGINGNGQAHNTLPPYVTGAFIIKY